jgi:hypothetical protein
LDAFETVEDVFNLLETGLTLLKDNLDPSFLEQFEVFAPLNQGRTPDFDPYELFVRHLYCFHNDIYDPLAVYHALHHESAWRQCGFPRAPSRDLIRYECFLTLCLRLVVVTTNYERGDSLGSTVISV